MQYETRGRKILVADADRTVLELLQIRLEVAGYHTCVVRTGPDVMEMLKNTRPEVMMLDLGLPEMDGFEVMEALKTRYNNPPIRTLVMGRKVAPEDIKRAASLGARDCLIKPFSGADALERVGRLLRQSTPSQPARPVRLV